MKHIIVFFLLALLSNSICCQNYNRISKEILECHNRLEEKETYNQYYYELRKTSQLLQKIHGKQNSDTIYIMEFHGDLPSKYLYITAWNNLDTMYIEAEDLGKGKILLNQKYCIFSKYMYFLVSNWNYNELVKEGKQYPGGINEEYVFATRIIFNKRKYYIDCMCFRDFFKLDRDNLNSK